MVENIRSKERNEMNEFDKLNEVRSVNLQMVITWHVNIESLKQILDGIYYKQDRYFINDRKKTK